MDVAGVYIDGESNKRAFNLKKFRLRDRFPSIRRDCKNARRATRTLAIASLARCGARHFFLFLATRAKETHGYTLRSIDNAYIFVTARALRLEHSRETVWSHRGRVEVSVRGRNKGEEGEWATMAREKIGDVTSTLSKSWPTGAFFRGTTGDGSQRGGLATFDSDDRRSRRYAASTCHANDVL